MQYCMEFIVFSNQLWCKNPQGQHKMVVPNDVGHHRVYATNALLSECYWWPNMSTDIKWYIQTCYICQIQNTQQLLIPPVIAMPVPLFSKVYMDTMYMPTSAGYRYITQGCCSLIRMGYATKGNQKKFRKLDFIYQ
jgi:Integrase zinc binding domain